MSVYAFVEREKANHAVRRMCYVLGVAPSGYWAWRKRAVSARVQRDTQLTERIQTMHDASRGTYGAPRIHATLVAEGVHCGRKRVARLMRLAGLVGCHRRRPFHTTVRDPQAEAAPDLVQRQFVASAPNQLWIADITYIPTSREGFLYLAVILDVFSRRVVGWAMAPYLRTDLVVSALELGDGRLESPAQPRGHSPLGPWLSVHLAALWRTLSGGGHPLLDGRGRRLLRQRHGGEFLCDPGMRALGAPALPKPTSWLVPRCLSILKSSTIANVGIRRSATCHRIHLNGGGSSNQRLSPNEETVH